MITIDDLFRIRLDEQPSYFDHLQDDQRIELTNQMARHFMTGGDFIPTPIAIAICRLAEFSSVFTLEYYVRFFV